MKRENTYEKLKRDVETYFGEMQPYLNKQLITTMEIIIKSENEVTYYKNMAALMKIKQSSAIVYKSGIAKIIREYIENPEKLREKKSKTSSSYEKLRRDVETYFEEMRPYLSKKIETTMQMILKSPSQEILYKNAVAKMNVERKTVDIYKYTCSKLIREYKENPEKLREKNPRKSISYEKLRRDVETYFEEMRPYLNKQCITTMKVILESENEVTYYKNMAALMKIKQSTAMAYKSGVVKIIREYIENPEKLREKNSKKLSSFEKLKRDVETYFEEMQPYLSQKIETTMQMILESPSPEIFYKNAVAKMNVERNTVEIYKYTCSRLIREYKENPEKLREKKSKTSSSYEKLRRDVETYFEEMRPYLSKKIETTMQMILESPSLEIFYKNAVAKMNVERKTVEIYKYTCSRLIREYKTIPQKWKEVRQKVSVGWRKEISYLSLKHDVEKYFGEMSSYLNKQLITTMKVILESENEEQFYRNSASFMKLERSSSVVYKRKVAKAIQEYKKNPETWKKSNQSKTTRTKQFILYEALKQDVEKYFEDMKMYLMPREIKVMENILDSRSEEIFLINCLNQMRVERKTIQNYKYRISCMLNQYKKNPKKWKEERAKQSSDCKKEKLYLSLRKDVETYFEEMRPYSNKLLVTTMEVILESENEEQFYRNLISLTKIERHSAISYKRRVAKAIQEYKENSKKWKEERSKKVKFYNPYDELKRDVETCFEEMRPYLRQSLVTVMKTILESADEETFYRNITSLMKIKQSTAIVYKGNAAKVILEYRENPEKWKEEKESETIKLRKSNSYAELKQDVETYFEEMRPYLNPKLIVIMETILKSVDKEKYYENIESSMKVSSRTAIGYRENIARIIREYKENPEKWKEEREKNLKYLTSYNELKQDVETYFEEMRPYLNPRLIIIMETILKSADKEKYYENMASSMKVSPRTAIGYRGKIARIIREYKENPEMWKLQIKQNSEKPVKKPNQRKTVKAKKVLSQAEIEELYFLYQPYLPKEKREVLEQWLASEDKQNQVTPIINFLVRCDNAIKNGMQLPTYTEAKKKSQSISSKKLNFLNSIMPQDVIDLLSVLESVSEIPHYRMLCLFYGIESKRYTIEEIKLEYPGLSLNQIASGIEKALVKTKELAGKENKRKKLASQLALSRHILTKTEQVCINLYLGLKGPSMSIPEIARRYRISEKRVLNIIRSAKSKLVQSNIDNNPIMVASLEKISRTVGQEQLEDKDIRPLRLMIEKNMTNQELKLTMDQIRLLNVFYGFDGKEVKSIKQIAENSELLEEQLRKYVVVLVRYILNYITEEDLEQELIKIGITQGEMKKIFLY